MLQGDFAPGEYFLDCDVASQSRLKSLFGAWITICVGIIAISLRKIYGSMMKRRLFRHEAGGEPISLWYISPPTSPFEVLELRRVLVRSLFQRQFFYLAASLVCVFAALISALSTTIANYTIVSMSRNRTAVVPGRLATTAVGTMDEPSATIARTVSRVVTLNNSNAPLDQLFDFLPDDDSGWVYVAEEWNNTWQGNCTYSIHPAVDLVIQPSATDYFQDQVPLLGSFLPGWAALDRAVQGIRPSVWFTPSPSNASLYIIQDLLIIYVFGTITNASGAYTNDSSTASNLNFVFANIAAHDIPLSGLPLPGLPWNVTTTAFQSDVHVTDCTFVNSAPGTYFQTYPDGSSPFNIALNLAGVFGKDFGEAAANKQPIQQPTAQDMLRAAQAYESVKDTMVDYSVQRRLTVYRPVVQIRLSVVVATVTACLLAVVTASILRRTEPRDQLGERLKLPTSQFEWTYQAAREHYRGRGVQFTMHSPVDFAMQNIGLAFLPMPTADGRLSAFVESSTGKVNMKLPSLGPGSFVAEPGWVVSEL